jgi:S1-C subfamily serine protease
MHLLGLLTATCLATASGVLPMRSAVAQTTPGGTEYVDAVANSSLAHIRVVWKGWLVVPRKLALWDGYYQAKGTYGPFAATVTCSGFVVSSTGQVVTAGHCVDANSYTGGKGAVLAIAMAGWHDASGNLLSPSDQARLGAILEMNADIEGIDSGSSPERTVKVTVPALEGTAHPASVIDVQPFKDGDVALLGVTGLQAPMLTAASKVPESGASVVAAGFSGSVNQIVDANKAPTFSPGNVSGTQTVNGTPFTQISSRTSAGMSGGPVLDMLGTVVGTVSWAPSGVDTSSDFMTSAGSITSILSGNGVDNTLSVADQAYRKGLADYYAGRYHAAVTAFDEALALQPAWKMVTEIKLKAVAKYPDEVIPKKSSGAGFPTWAYVAIAGGVLLLGAAGLGVLLMRRRGARRAPAGPPVAPTTAAPSVMQAPVTPPPMTTVPPPPAVTSTVPAAGTVAPAAGGHHDFCPNCGVKHAAGAHYCEECGQPLPAAMPTEHEVG